MALWKRPDSHRAKVEVEFYLSVRAPPPMPFPTFIHLVEGDPAQLRYLPSAFLDRVFVITRSSGGRDALRDEVGNFACPRVHEWPDSYHDLVRGVPLLKERPGEPLFSATLEVVFVPEKGRVMCETHFHPGYGVNDNEVLRLTFWALWDWTIGRLEDDKELVGGMLWNLCAQVIAYGERGFPKIRQQGVMPFMVEQFRREAMLDESR